MHELILREVVATCRQRQREGDCPSIPPFPVEVLEDAVVQLHTRLWIVLNPDIGDVQRDEVDCGSSAPLSGETSRSESAQPPAPDFERARGAAYALDRTHAPISATWVDHLPDILSVLSAAESRLSLLEAQNAELRASQREHARLLACEQVLLALHADLGIKWGDDPYWAVKQLRVSLEAAKADSERLDFVESQRQTLWASQGAPTTESWCVLGPEGSSFRDNIDGARASRSGQGETA